MTQQGEELVWAVPRSVLMDGLAWRGVLTSATGAVLGRIALGSFYPRPAAEMDDSIKQIIPYMVLRQEERLFLMRRTRAGGDARLHDHYTIGIGGHMNPGDDTVETCLRREWREEIVADFMPEFEFLGLLNDDEVEVGRHHLGVVYLADAGGRQVSVRETHKLAGSFETVASANEVYDRMETWSQLVLDALLGRTSSPAPESHR